LTKLWVISALLGTTHRLSSIRLGILEGGGSPEDFVLAQKRSLRTVEVAKAVARASKWSPLTGEVLSRDPRQIHIPRLVAKYTTERRNHMSLLLLHNFGSFSP